MLNPRRRPSILLRRNKGSFRITLGNWRRKCVRIGRLQDNVNLGIGVHLPMDHMSWRVNPISIQIIRLSHVRSISLRDTVHMVIDVNTFIGNSSVDPNLGISPLRYTLTRSSSYPPSKNKLLKMRLPWLDFNNLEIDSWRVNGMLIVKERRMIREEIKKRIQD